MKLPEPTTITAMTAAGYVNWPWLTLNEFTKLVGCGVAVFMAALAYRKHRLEMKLLKAKIDQ